MNAKQSLMNAVKTSGWGPAARLTVSVAQRPVPGDDDVLVRVCAASVNPKDWKLNYQLARWALPLGRRWMPPLFGDDLAGVIEAVGANVKDFAVGDSVYGMDMRLRTATLAEYAKIDQGCVALKPKRLSFTEAAAVPLAALTALQGLRKGRVREGALVLIIGASGGVGTFAVQFAKVLGCHVTAVCSGRNANLVRELGADAVIDYTAGDYRHHAGRFDLVFDVSSHESPHSCRDLLKQEGMFISTAGNARAAVLGALADKKRAALIRVEPRRRDLETIAAWIDADQVRVVIDSCFPLDRSQEAYDLSRSGRARGKIALEIAG